MVTKWKNRVVVFVSALFLVAGWMLFVTSFNIINDNKRNEQENGDFYQQIEMVYAIDYLKNFGSKTINLDGISGERVDRYRYQYGDLQVQILDVNQQYQESIQEAKAEKKADDVKRLTTERDEKVLAIVTNFTDSDAVRKKIAEEETKKIMKGKAGTLEYLEANKKEFDDSYYYYFSDSNGKIFKNVSWLSSKMKPKEIKGKLNSEGIGELIEINQAQMRWDMSPETSILQEVAPIELSGFVIPIKGSTAAKNYQLGIESEKRNKKTIVIGVALLLLGCLLAVVYLKQGIINKKVAAFIQKMPLDLRVILLISGILIIGHQMASSLNVYYYLMDKGFILISVGCYLLLLIMLVLVKDFWLTIRRKENYPPFKEQSYEAIYYKIGHRLVQSSPYFKAGLALTILALSLCLAVVDGHGRNLIGVIVLFSLVGAVALLTAFAYIRRENRLSQLLKQPALILEENGDNFVKGNSLVAVEENLAELNQIVSATKANKLRNEELKTELLTNVSHDLRTPLTSIITYGDLLTKEQLTEPARQEYTTIINKKALRMKNLIDDLFEVTKMNNGEIILNKKMINLGQLIQQSIAEYGDEFAAKDLKILYTKPQESILLAIDGDRMWRVFDNLIGNVVKYSMTSTRVYLKLEKRGNEAVIQLKNISQHELHENAESLVERFKRGDEARQTEGSGLGLAIANSIVDLHDGRLDIEIDGDMFKITIYLPLSED